MSNLKVYVAGRARYRVDEIRNIVKKLQKNGYQVTYDWTANDSKLVKPYRQNRSNALNIKHQQDSLNGAAAADIFILLDDEGLRGAYIEFGAFLKHALDNPKGRMAYIVGKNSDQRQHVFESGDIVKIKETIEEVYKDLGLSN